MVSCRAGNYAGRYLLRTRLSGLERLRSQHNNHSHQLPNVKMSIILQISNCVSQFFPFQNSGSPLLLVSGQMDATLRQIQSVHILKLHVSLGS